MAQRKRLYSLELFVSRNNTIASVFYPTWSELPTATRCQAKGFGFHIGQIPWQISMSFPRVLAQVCSDDKFTLRIPFGHIMGRIVRLWQPVHRLTRAPAQMDGRPGRLPSSELIHLVVMSRLFCFLSRRERGLEKLRCYTSNSVLLLCLH